MSLATGLKATASKLITKYGGAGRVVYKDIDAGTYNPATGAFTGNSVNTYSLPAHVSGYADKFVDGKAILASDRKLLASASDFLLPPARGDIVVMESVNWKVLEISTSKTEGTAVIYTLQLRR